MLPPVANILNDSLTLKLLRARNAALILGFLHDAFKERNHTLIEAEALEHLLLEYLKQNATADDLRADDLSPDTGTLIPTESTAKAYLNRWCTDDFRYLRTVFAEDRQCFLYQLTQHSEKALQWLNEIATGARAKYTTTESRFSRIFAELQALTQQTNDDPKARLKTLLAQRDALDAEIQQIRATKKVPRLLQPAQVRDRLLDLEQMAGAFLADFRAIEDHFKEQAHDIAAIYLERNRSKGDIVEHALDAHERLRNSEQGRSYYGFRDLLGQPDKQQALAIAIAAAARLARDAGTDERVFLTLMERLLESGAIVQETFRKIASQLRRVVEESATQNTRLVLEQIGDIKKLALARRDQPDATDDDNFLEITDGIAWANLMELGFYEKKEPAPIVAIDNAADPAAAAELTAAIHRIGRPFNIEQFRRNVATLLAERDQDSLRQLLDTHPATDGAVDLVGYLCVAAEDPRHLISETEREDLDLARPEQPRYATLNKIIYQNR
jgi:hypothetical protein